MSKPEAPLIEPIAVQDLFVCGVCEPEVYDDFVRLIFWAKTRTEPHYREKTVVAKLTLTTEAFRRVRGEMLRLRPV